MTSNTTALPVADLQAYTNYSFMVRAVNYAGIGPYSRIVTNRTFEAGKFDLPFVKGANIV